MRVGSPATARVRIDRIEKKGFAKGSPMVFVHQNIDYTSPGEKKPAVMEERIHVYMPREARADSRIVREGAPDLTAVSISL